MFAYRPAILSLFIDRIPHNDRCIAGDVATRARARSRNREVSSGKGHGTSATSGIGAVRRSRHDDLDPRNARSSSTFRFQCIADKSLVEWNLAKARLLSFCLHVALKRAPSDIVEDIVVFEKVSLSGQRDAKFCRIVTYFAFSRHREGGGGILAAGE